MHLTVWNNQILLHWDGTLPEGCDLPLAHVQANPDVLRGYWKDVGPYMKYSTRKGFFFMSLSKQNLQRIYRQFGRIDVRQGYFRIEDLKTDLAMFKEQCAAATQIKNGKTLTIQYKMPPLGHYQHVGVSLLVETKQVALFADCGVGKSYMTLVSTEEQIKRGYISRGKTLVCGKLATLETGWMEDCKKFTDLKPSLLWAKPGAKRKEKLLAALNEDADIYIINHEGLKVLETELVQKRFEKVVVDESTILKSYYGDGNFSGGKLGKCLMKIAAAAQWRVIMSGTPAPNTYQDLWGQIHFLDPNGFMLEASIRDFRTSFMKEVFFGKPGPNTPSTWKPSSPPEEVFSHIEPITYRVRIRDHLHDLPQKTIIKRFVQLTPEQDVHYKHMTDLLMTVIDDETVSVQLKLAQVAKLRQITSGFLIDAEENVHPMEINPKLEMLDQLLNEEISHEEKVVIYCQYRWEIETLAERYKDYGVGTVYGGQGTTNLENIKRFINDPSMRIIILHPKSAAHGVTFTCSHYMIFFSISYSNEDDYQCQARIERAGQRHPMFIYYLLAQGTIDEDIDEVLRQKQIGQEMLLDQDSIDKQIFDRFSSRRTQNEKKTRTRKVKT